MKTYVNLFSGAETKVLRDEDVIKKCRKLKCPLCGGRMIVSHTSQGAIAERTLRRITMRCSTNPEHSLQLCDEFKTKN